MRLNTEYVEWNYTKIMHTSIQSKDLFCVRISTNIDSAACVHPTIPMHKKNKYATTKESKICVHLLTSTCRKKVDMILRKHAYVYANKYARV